MDLHPDFTDVLAEFTRCGVRFAVVGAYAVGHHATAQATKDLELLISSQGGNLDLAAEALAAFGAPAFVVEAVQNPENREVVFLGVAPARIAIWRSVDGIETDGAIQRAEQVDVGGLTIAILGLDDLIASKKASGRPRDRSDLELLDRTRRV